MIREGLIWFLISVSLFLVFYYFIFMDYGLGVLFGGGALFGTLQMIVGWFTYKGMTENGMVVVINDLFKMPKTMKQLALVQFFSWFALFSMWIYTTAGGGRRIAYYQYGRNMAGNSTRIWRDANSGW